MLQKMRKCVAVLLIISLFASSVGLVSAEPTATGGGQNSEGELCSLHPMHADYYMQRFRIPDDIAEDEVEIFIHFLVD